MKPYRYESETLLDAPLAQVFDFFSKAENLEALTPSTLKFQILTPLPIEIRKGTLIDYKLTLHGIPFRWRTEISIWEPNHRFMDRQLKGPYKMWEHEHRFAAEGDKTRMWDTVNYLLPGGPLGAIPHALFIRREIEGIFAFRSKVLQQALKAKLV